MANAQGIVVRPLARREFTERLDALAALRITVFRDWPYLYDGDLAYEHAYLAAYLEAQGAVIIGAFDGNSLVGAATAAPLSEHHAEFAQPLIDQGLDPARHFYFGESVLLAPYRGKGIGVHFFEHREAAARGQGFDTTLFSAVSRAVDHPARPADYLPLDHFWSKRGYERLPGVTAQFSWRDLGDVKETPKPMEFWRRRFV
jgi:GNAT superfamily N-acetyltransferase